jgi:hypothetical protein
MTCGHGPRYTCQYYTVNVWCVSDQVFLAVTLTGEFGRVWRGASLREGRRRAQFTELRRCLSLAAANSIGDRVTKALPSSSTPSSSLEMRLIFDSIFSLASQICTPWPCLQGPRSSFTMVVGAYMLGEKWCTLKSNDSYVVRTASISKLFCSVGD